MVTFFKDSQLLNTPSPISTIVLGIVISVIVEYVNAYSPIEVTPSERVKLAKFVQR